MPTKNSTSFICVILTVALVWSSLGAGLLSAPAKGIIETIVDESALTETSATTNTPVNTPAKPHQGIETVNGGEEITSAYGGWNLEPGAIPADWSFLDANNVPEVSNMGYSGEGVKVAVVDTGIDFGAQNLAGKYMIDEDSASPYYGWPMAFDAYGLPEFLLAKEARPEMGGIANTSINGTGPFDISHTIKVDGQRDFNRNELVGEDKANDIKPSEFDLNELWATRDDTFWYAGLRTRYGALNRTFGFALDFDGPTSGSTTDPRGNLLDFEASHSAPVEQVAYSPSKGLIASCAANGADPAITNSYDINSVKVWDENGNLVRSLPIEQNPVFSVAWSPNGNFLAYETTMEVVVYNTNTWAVAHRITHSTTAIQTYYRESMCFSPDGTMLAVGSIEASNRIQMLNVLTGATSRPEVPTTTTSIAYSPDGWSIALGQSNGKVQLLNSTTYKLTALLENSDGRAIETIAWEPNNDFIATGRSTSGNVEVWDLNAGNNTCQWGDGASVIENIVINSTGGRINTIDRFFFRGIQNEANVNGLPAYQLGMAPTNNLQYSTLMPNAQNFTWGIRVWVRHSAGNETELTNGVEAIVYRDMDGSGTQTGEWMPNVTSLAPTDSLVIRIYQGNTPIPATLAAEFTSLQFGDIDANITELGNNIPIFGEQAWRINYQTRKNTASVDTIMTGGHEASSTVNTIKWTTTQIITGSNDGKIVTWNPSTYAVTNTYNTKYNSPIISFDMKSNGDMFVGTKDCTVRKYPTGWATPISFAAHKPDIMIYVDYEREYYEQTSQGLKLLDNDKIEDPLVYKWSGTAWVQTNITNIFGNAFYKGNLAGEWTEHGFLELAIPRNYTAWPNQNEMFITAFVCGRNVSTPQDTVPSDYNVPSSTANLVDWAETKLTTLGSWGHVEIATVVIDNASIKGKSGTYHFGNHPSAALTNLFGTTVPMVVAESTTIGVWDRIYVDMNMDYTIDGNDPYVDKANPVLTVDIWNYSYNASTSQWETTPGPDGVPDISGGLLYFIGDGNTLMPYSERVSSHLLDDGRLTIPFGTEDNPWNIPGNGEVVAFFGDFDVDFDGDVLSTGTQSASAIAGAGLNKGSNEKPIVGVSPNVTFLPICNAHKGLTMALYFAVEGYDGIPNTNDEADIVNIGPYSVGYGSGLDATTQLVEYLVNMTASNALFISPAGNFGSGYGTVAAPCGMNTLVVGFAEDNALIAGGGVTQHYGDVSELSSRGPTAAGLAKPDVIAIGLGDVDMPLGTKSPVGGKNQYTPWKGSELATAITTGVAALMFEAYKEKHGQFPSTETAMSIIRSSARDLGHDPMTQGSGFVDALAAVRMAKGTSGLTMSAERTSFGNTFGASYDSFINVLAPGQNDTFPITVSNPTGSPINAAYGFEYMSRIGINERVELVDTNIGYKEDISSMVPANAEVIKVTAQTNYSWNVPWENGTGSDYKTFTSESGSFFMRLWDWTDAQQPGQLNYGIIDPVDDLSYLTGVEHGYVNAMICTLSNPHGNLNGKLVLEIVQDLAAGNVMKVQPWRFTVESFATVPVDWMSPSKASANILAGASDSVGLTVNVPANQQAGTYAGSLVAQYDTKSNNWAQNFGYTAMAENEYLNVTLETTSWDDGMEGNYWDGDTTTPYPIEVGKADNFPLAAPADTYSTARVAHAPITITGNSDFASIAARGSGTVSDPWIIENLDITAPGQIGISISNTDQYFIIRNCAITNQTTNPGIDDTYAISLNSVINGVILSNVLTSNEGLYVYDCENVLINGNYVVNHNLYGVYIEGSSSIIVSENEIAGSAWGEMTLVNVHDSMIVDNNIHDTFVAMEIYYLYNTIITGNNFNAPYGYGVYIDGGENNEIFSNIFDGFDGGSGMYSITLTTSDPGLYPVINNLVNANDFTNCVATHAYDDGPNNDWDGNYWGTSYGINDGGSGSGVADNAQELSSVATAQTRYTPHAPITIIGDANFTLANGVVAGNGSVDNPYIISGWEIDMTGQACGIRLTNTTAHFLVVDNHLFGNSLDGIGIQVLGAINGTIRSNELHTIKIGIHIKEAYGIVAFLNDIQANSDGIYVEIADGTVAAYNKIDGGDRGIHLLTSDMCHLSKNVISGAGVAGIALEGITDDTLVENNYISGCADAIFSTLLADSVIAYNHMESNTYGIRLSNSTGINTLHHNNFFGNTYHAYDDFPGDSLSSFEIFSYFGEPANYTSIYDVFNCTITVNGVPLTLGVDYTVDYDTGLVTFTPPQLGQSGGAEVSIKAVLTYEEQITMFKLPDTRLVSGGVVVKVIRANGTMETLNATAYTLHYKTGIVELTAPLSIGRGVWVWANYSYYNRTGIVPVTLNVLTAESADFTFGNMSATETPSIMPVWGVRAGQGAVKGSGERLESGDRRYFYVRIPNQGMFSVSELASFYLYTELMWALNQSDVNVIIYGKGATSISGNVAPYVMNKLGASEEKADFSPLTATNGPKDILVTPFNHEILTICVSSKTFNGTGESITKFEGKSGWLKLSDNNPKVWTNDLVGSMDVSFNSNVELPGVYASIVGPAQGSRTTEEIYQDDLSLFDLSTLEGWLTMNAVAGFTKVFSVKNALSWDVHIFGHPECVDLDLAVFLDGLNGNPIDGIAQWQEIITTKDISFDAYGDNYGSGSYAYSADADADEALKFISPPDGDYIVKVLGYTVTSAPGYFDLEVKTIFSGVEGYKLSHLDTEFEDEDTASGTYINTTHIEPFDGRGFQVQWAFPEETKDDVYGGIFVLGVPDSQKLIVFSVDIVLDRLAPKVTPVFPSPGAIISNNQPIITAKLEDPSRGELDPKGATIEIDGLDISQIAKVSVTETENSAAVLGYWVGDILFTPIGPLAEGGHTFTVEAKDLAGNPHKVSWGFTVDTTKPALTLSNMDDIIYTNTASYSLDGVTEPSSVVSVVGAPNIVRQRIDNTFSIDLELEAGENFVSIKSTDLAGNVYEASKTIIMDVSAPTFKRVVALDGSNTNKRMTGIYGEVSEAGSLQINGQPIQVNSDGTFRHESIQLIEGRNQQILKFTDMAGNVAYNYMNITMDTAAPILMLAGIEKTVYSESLNITGETETGVASLTINGKLVSVDGTGNFQQSIRLSPGTNTIVIESKDRAGNSAQEVLTVNYVTDTVERNWGAIGLMIGLLIMGLILGMLLGPMILGMLGMGKEKPEQEMLPEEILPEEEAMPEEAVPGEAIEVQTVEGEVPEPAPEELTVDVPEPTEVPEIEPTPEETTVPEEPSAETEPEVITEEPTAPAEPEDPRIMKLRDAFESGKISKELYEKNLAKFKGQ